MNKSMDKIEISTELAKKLQLNQNDQLQGNIDHNGIMLRKTMKSNPDTEISTWWNVLMTILAGVVFWGYFRWQRVTTISLTGTNSIASLTITLGLLMGMLLFTICLIKTRKTAQHLVYHNVYWRNFPTLIISCAAVLLICLLGLFWVLTRVFYGVSFGIFTATLIFLLFQLGINTIMNMIAANLTPNMLVGMLGITIIGGLLISMVSNGNRQWWRHNISFLGTNRAVDSWQFSLTFILAAFLFLALVDYLFVSLQPLQRPWLPTICLRILLTVMAISALVVGLLPNNRHIPWQHFWHDQFAWLMALDIIVLIIGIRWLWPGISASFLRLSDLMGVLLVISSWLFAGIHYFSLTAYEIVASLLAFSWLMMLFQYMLTAINVGTRQVSLRVLIRKQKA
ncbi:hypothetical protein B808_703 [Fructilactobacillus florum 8D]|uniref:DUF998 domain-containing protein n=2 Tax=Fructilactobacillus florum TaxID=640331 RepID=W9EDZ5_9LACO|nr:DUF998 domain-containing protein [Fructilactobacillus florum]ETO40353.1 hypothetical protein B808_703 [Fructilactobacillus florum 8D]KRM92321.1 hypothetical protein FC87_GL000454 [Fructilactobacillus florum DSM 22689 = JCM 16035]